LIRVLSEAGFSSCVGFQSSEEMEEVAEPGWSNSLFLVNFGRQSGAVAHGVASLKARRPHSRVVVLADEYSHHQILEAIKAGAAGYVLASASCEAMIKSLEVIALGEYVIPEQALQLLMGGEQEAAEPIIQTARQRPSVPSTLLSARELEVLACISHGMSNKLIAREWDISEATVKVHVKAILRKIRVKNRTEAARWAWDNGLAGRGALNRSGRTIPMTAAGFGAVDLLPVKHDALKHDALKPDLSSSHLLGFPDKAR
jgi:two-component system nitrate/nitrite response regulator NarL